jgi:hypothetical protein
MSERLLNAVGKPFSASYDPNYRLKHVTSTGHLRFPYLRIKFVGEEEREAHWWARPRHLRKQARKQQRQAKEAMTPLSWKENTRKPEFTARAPLGGYYILAPFLHCWNVDYRERRGGERRQLGLACTLDEAIAEADSRNKGEVSQ